MNYNHMPFKGIKMMEERTPPPPPTTTAKTTTTAAVENYHFVLVHGFGGGAWCWYKVRTLLEASGHKVTCLDLKASGIDPTAPQSLPSFEAYTQPLTDFLSNYLPTKNPQEKIILVGHSAGGLSVTNATHEFADKIHVAVYVAATMLKHGFATEQDVIDGVPEILRSEEYATMDKKEFNRSMIYNMSPPEDFNLATMLVRPTPNEAVKTAKFESSGTHVDSVPRVYIKTLQDRLLMPAQQEAMMSRWPPARVFHVDSDHNPNFSVPFLLSGLLVQAADL